ncbi:putative ankyrin repeat protein [Beauveria bassiana]|nr:putative ankyrin repeat protein [Beauveria bassiana]
MSFNHTNTSRETTEDEGLTPRGSKRQRLNDTIYTHGSTLAALSHEKYTVGWICALPIEMSAAVAMLDETHQGLPRADEDTNTYTLGRVAAHNVAIACLPSGYYGNNNAAAVATNMRRTFPCMRLCLMVGIGGGAPGKADIRLGDVVVSEGVLQYDLGKALSEGRFTRTGIMNRPPQELLTAVANLRARHRIEASRIPSILSEMLERHPTMAQFVYRNSLQDRLFDSTYDHVQSKDVPTDDCELCDISRLEDRSPRNNPDPKIHYGTIASANQVMKQVKTRDELAHELDVLCFEMEGSGVMDGFAGLVIRGICDYSDSHKNKQWQEVAATVAAAYAKELLLVIPADVCTAALVVAIPSVDLDRQQTLLHSLGFEQIHARRSSIKPKYSTTCRWLLAHPDYLNWQDPKQAVKHHGFLWIRGGPGTGKSTIMNFAYKEATTHKDVVVISFFFNARGESLERSTHGMYRSLLSQLLNTLPNLLSIFDAPEHKRFLDDFYTALLSHHNPMWQIVVLQDLLRSALTKLGQTPLAIFVDALDECSSDQVEELVEYFEALGEEAERNGLRLNICFSSRYYPYIDIQYGLKIKLEAQDGHEEDVAMYIRNKLRIGTSKTAQEIKTEMQAKAKGIFMWVVLVVDILKAEYRDGRIFEVKKRLAALPDELSDLFKEILARDQKNIRDLKICIQWILFAKRPLKLEEYYFAAVSALSPDELGEWDRNDITTEDMSRFVISSSKGLAETTRSKVKTVQFIHESVREFFLKNALHELWPNLAAEDFESVGHSTLQQCCYAYFNFCVVFKSEACLSAAQMIPAASSDEAKELRSAVSGKFPFLEYATRNLFYHADITASSIPQHEFLRSFSFESWILLDNLFEMFRIRRHKPTTSLLHVLAERNFARLIQEALQLDSRVEIKGGRHRYPLFAALANGNHDAVKALLQTSAYLPGNDVFTRLDYGPNFRVENDQTPLHWAAARGHDVIVKLLIEKGSHIRAEDKRGRTPLSHAVKNGHYSTVRLLLQNGCDFRKHNNDWQSPLLYAAMNGNDAIMRLLLENGADIEAQDCNMESPLRAAASFGEEKAVRLLLEAGADIEAKDNAGRTALTCATEREREAIVQLLLEKGADVESPASGVHNPLIVAATHAYENVLRLLLKAGANIEAKDNSGMTSLIRAAMNGHEAIVCLLLTEGADIEAKDEKGMTSLIHATIMGRKATVRLLLREGADIEAKSNRGMTSLIYAAGCGNEAIVRLLLEKGANVEAVGPEGNSPLTFAASLGRENVVRLLLEAGADINKKDSRGWPALTHAVESEHKAIVRLLLMKGANIEAKDHIGSTPLGHAIQNGLEDIVLLLLM